MKRIALLLSFVLVLFASAMHAQIRAGIKGGISTIDVTTSPLIIENESGSPVYEMGIEKTKLGVHLGFFVQAELGPVFFQPELLFNSQSIDYSFTDVNDPNATVQVRDENYQTLDVPLILGLKFGPVRFGGGMVGHLFLNNRSDFNDDELFGNNYQSNFETLTWGWQAGIGFDFWKLHIDARYEGNLDNFGNHMEFYGKGYEFDNPPSRIIVSLGISF